MAAVCKRCKHAGIWWRECKYPWTPSEVDHATGEKTYEYYSCGEDVNTDGRCSKYEESGYLKRLLRWILFIDVDGLVF